MVFGAYKIAELLSNENVYSVNDFFILIAVAFISLLSIIKNNPDCLISLTVKERKKKNE
jgi:hypothetical protein